MNTYTLKILAISVGIRIAASNLHAQATLTNLYAFVSSVGAAPEAGLVQGSDGYFYGTTAAGGTNTQGIVFRITSGGSLTTLFAFSHFSSGDQPVAGLVQGVDGNFYGTTSLQGANVRSFGTVFQISTNGSLTNLHVFTDNPDGATPDAGLVQGTDGYFYGTTSSGGTNESGTIYRINASGSGYSVLYSFTSASGGANPVAGLIQGTDGNFYGTTESGGTNGGGTVFQFNTNGSMTILHSFPIGANDGSNAAAGLVRGSDGYFYGTTKAGGGTNKFGTVFRISPSGSYSNLYSFTSNSNGYPQAGLVQGSDGNFYGTTSSSPSRQGSANGNVFRISPGGSYSNLYSFNGSSTGAEPFAGLVQGSDGNFYGTTSAGGTSGNGTVFKLIVPLNPPANQISAIQVAGTNVLVTIPSVAGEIYQLQYRNSLTAGAWSDVAGASAKSIGGSLTVTNFGGFSQSQQFYRFAITP